MQITATIQKVQAVGQTIDVVVSFMDDQGNVGNETLNFQDGANVTPQQVTDEITRKAIKKAQVGVSETLLKALLNQPPIVVDEKSPPPKDAIAAAAADAVAVPG